MICITSRKNQHWNGHEKVAQLLLTGGADFNQADKEGVSPLVVAAQEGLYKIMRLLLQYDTNNYQKTKYTTLLAIAKSRSHSAVVGLIEAVIVEHEAKQEQSSREAEFPTTTQSNSVTSDSLSAASVVKVLPTASTRHSKFPLFAKQAKLPSGVASINNDYDDGDGDVRLGSFGAIPQAAK